MRILVAFQLSLSACSFSGVTTARRGAPDRIECLADPAVPLLDTAFAVGGFIAAGALLIQAESEPPISAYVDRMGGVLLGIGAMVATVSAIYGHGELESCERTQEAARADEQASKQRARTRLQAQAQAWAATKQAAAAARAADCATVMLRSGEVLALDPEFHATVFLRDVAIERCIDAEAVPAQVPPAP